FFSSRRRHTRFSRDWSSDVCSSDLNFPTEGIIATFFIFSMEADRVTRRNAVPVRNAVTITVTRYAVDLEHQHTTLAVLVARGHRSEERRVGKERRSRWALYRVKHSK